MVDDVRFDWDESNIAHLARHRIEQKEAQESICNGFVDLNYEVVDGEERFVVIGVTNAGRVLTLVWTYRGDAIRVITGWDSTAVEQVVYWPGS